ncbi:MAG: preprotein translocase subunit SecE [Bacteroidota bacterium]
MRKLQTFIVKSIQEVRYNVTWPAYEELQGNAILVLIASLIFAVAIGFIDWGFRNITEWFYRMF